MAEKKIDEHIEHGPAEADAVSLPNVKRVPLDDTVPAQIQFHPGLPSVLTISPWISAAMWFVPGVICIRYFCNPATFRRRATVLGLGATMAWFDQYTRFNFINPAATRILSAKENTPPEIWEYEALLWRPFVYLFPDVRTAHRKELEQYVSDEMVSKYIERERIRDRESALSEVLAFKWRNLWSSIKTRAAIDNILNLFIEDVDPQNEGLPDKDVRHCGSYVGAMLDQPDRGDVQVVHGLWLSSVLAGVVFSNLWVLRTAAAVGFCSGLGSVAFLIHVGQLCTDIDKYSSPEAGVLLHLAYFSTWGTLPPVLR